MRQVIKKRFLMGAAIGAVLLIGVVIGSLTVGSALAQKSSGVSPNPQVAQHESDVQHEAQGENPGAAATPATAAYAAMNAALAQYPGASVTKLSLEDENGTLVYAVAIKTAAGAHLELKVDANSGAVLVAGAGQVDAPEAASESEAAADVESGSD